ncbi:mechanosensitive ion channel family protein [Cohnella cholangitidis]|uniref:Mechanosensitive ion channel family protein n=1 Tax=Cohnella cholangitidis TaxID=2598458 RepID=A0A7G5BYZ4_9BACL|nr:mechanosensitive ion channel family protein [Cohnella cholangitidis]QMV42178.1 mechanosensitive ion channel family protein [Cohnella cholangitidis]
MRALLATEQVIISGNLWNKFIDRITEMLQDTEMWTNAAMVLLRVILIILISRIVLVIVNRFIDHVTNEKKSKRLKLRTRRVQTMGRLLKNAASYVFNFIAILLILGEFHIQLAPLLAGAGVIGLAIGFGAQSLVKDVITGFFIILEDQFAVGDVIQTKDFKGTVEMIGLRATRIRNWTGEVHIIPNGLINEVTNFSVNPLLAVVDITIAYENTIEEMMTTIRNVLNQLNNPNITATPEVLGIQTLAFNQMTIRITARCKPNTTGEVTRLINTELKKAFEAAKTEATT